MAQQNKNSSQPQGFGGFDDLISEFSEDLVMPPQAKPVSPATSTASRSEPTKTPPAAPPRSNNPSKPVSAAKPNTAQDTQLIHLDDWIEMTAAEAAKLPAQHQPSKPEVRVIVEPKPASDSLTQATERGIEKVLWFSVVCGIIIFIYLFSSSNNNQASSKTSSSMATQSNPVMTPSTTTTRSEPTYRPITPSVTETPKPTYNDTTALESRPVAPSKPSTPKTESDPLVKEIQKKLLSLGYFPGSADGYVGQKTLNAIKKFQQENGLPVDTRMNEQLLSNLKEARPHVDKQRNQQEKSPRNESKILSNSAQSDVQKADGNSPALDCPMGEICVNRGNNPPIQHVDTEYRQ